MSTPSPAAAESAPTAGPRIGVVTVSYGSEGVLPAFLESVPAASAQHPLVIVADNKAPDPGVENIVASASARYLPMRDNLGYGGAMNAAVEALPDSVEWVLISNPDLVLEPGSIDTLVATGDSDPTIGAVGPATLTSEGEVYPSARAVPSLRTGVGHALFVNIWLGNPWTRAYRNDVTRAGVRADAGWLSGSCLLVRRSAFDAVGGFDPGYFMYFEDVDLGYRLGRAGHRNVYEPASVVTHTGAHSTSTDDESARMIAAHHESARRFLAKKYSGPLLWPIRFSLGIGLRMRSAMMSRRARG